ncbi:MAG: 2-C-methyl-D-erythritol 4-phosphate cytidylyltransferase [Alistipes sp.]|nr:2-C-methyl-D-erythritol 4-phosphate cytidylyltransferase [Alistipes sp.]
MAETGIIIVAGGSGQRMGSSIPKQFLMLGNQPVLVHSINRIHQTLPAAEIVVVLPEEHIPLWQNLAARFDVAKHKIATGGSERFYSVKNGLKELSDDVKIVAVHDAVRPLVSKKLLIRLVLQAEKSVAVIPTLPPVDSFRYVQGDDSSIIDRSALRIVQTPQMFNAEVLRRAYEQEFSTKFTDDASVVESMGEKITLCEGEHQNLKITTPEDLVIATALLDAEQEA